VDEASADLVVAGRNGTNGVTTYVKLRMTGFEPTVAVVVPPEPLEDVEPPELELVEPLDEDEDPELELVDPAEPEELELVEPLPDFALAEPAFFVVFFLLDAPPA
jgi:hypothetical protein